MTKTLGFVCALALLANFDASAKPPAKDGRDVPENPAEKQREKPALVPRGQSSDSAAYLKAAEEAEQLRVKRRISAEDFAKMAKEPGTIILDARSALAHEQLRIKGSVSLPYTDMAAETLAKVIPSKETKVLIYCRNNLLSENPKKLSTFPVSTPTIFEEKNGHRYPVEFEQPQVPKSSGAGLNIPTYITLYIYGYRNVWELDPVVDPNRSVIEFESAKLPPGSGK